MQRTQSEPLAGAEQARAELRENGFTSIPDVFSPTELVELAGAIEAATIEGPNLRQSADVFAIRNLLQAVPTLAGLLWQPAFNSLIDSLVGSSANAVKSIYFDKPAGSNWVVPWHQDLLISVNCQADVPGWQHWTNRHGQWSVQPSATYLQAVYTVRIHLDACDETNGALKIIPGTHRLGILPDETVQALNFSRAVTCNVPAGGLLVMQPLLVHASAKSSSPASRRVIHLEFSDQTLPVGLQWRELSRRK
jgi:hypothetical protein